MRLRLLSTPMIAQLISSAKGESGMTPNTSFQRTVILPELNDVDDNEGCQQ